MPERFTPMEALSPAEREMMEGATVEASKEEMEAANYTPEQQVVADALEALASRGAAEQKFVNAIKDKGLFTGTGSTGDRMLSALKSRKNEGMSEEDLRKQAKKLAERQYENLSREKEQAKRRA